jgi:hypothetical protein
MNHCTRQHPNKAADRHEGARRVLTIMDPHSMLKTTYLECQHCGAAWPEETACQPN